jgi:hypothetical protein
MHILELSGSARQVANYPERLSTRADRH